MRSHHRLGVALALLAAAAAGPAAAQGPPPPPVTVAKPVIKDIKETDDFIGRFEAVEQVDIRARVSGYLDKVGFKDGAIVKAGDLLFTIDQRPYRDALDQATATLGSAKATVDFTATDLDRADALRRSGNITEQVADQRRQAAATARAALDEAQAALNRAKLDMEFTEIRAPMAGRISRHLVSPGNLVAANDTLLTNIVSVDPVYFYFDIDERSYLAYLSEGLNGARAGEQSGDVAVKLTGEAAFSHAGRIDFLDNRLDQASGTMRGRAVLDNRDLSLTPGLFGRIQIAGSKSYKGILLPEDAVGTDQDRRVVYVVGSDNRVSAKPVRLGPHIDGYQVIRDGLTGGEVVVVNGLMRVRPGAVVDPKMTELPPVRETASR